MDAIRLATYSIVRNCKVCGKSFLSDKYSQDSNLYCSYACSGKSRRTRIKQPCVWCEVEVERLPSQIKKRKLVFCSNSCRSKYYIRQRHGFRRSWAEGVLLEMIRSDFPKHEILENRRDLLPSGYEIDIFVKDIQLAIELNGPCHYFNIHGDETLRKVQVRDAIKQKEIQEAGFQFIVLDISTISDRKKLRRFLEEQYQYNIKPILL